MEILFCKMSIWVALMIQLLLLYWTDTSSASQTKFVRTGKEFYPKHSYGDNESRVQLRDPTNKRLDDDTDQRSHKLLLIDVSNLGNMDNKKAGFDSKPKLLAIDTSVLLSKPAFHTFPDQSMDDFRGSNIDYDEENDIKNDIFPFPLDLSNNDAHTFHPAIDVFSAMHSSQTNEVPYNIPYTYGNSKSTSSEKNEESKETLPIPRTIIWPQNKRGGISYHDRVPLKKLSTLRTSIWPWNKQGRISYHDRVPLPMLLKRNIFQRKSSYH